MFDTVEERIVHALPGSASRSLIEGLSHNEESSIKVRLFLRALYNYMENPAPYRSKKFVQVLSKAETSTEELEEQLSEILKHMMVSGVTNPKSVKKYTTGELSPMFGVTVATINNWLKEDNKRIFGAEKAGPNKQYRIPETAIYSSASGEEITIKEIAEMYEEELKTTTIRELSVIEEQKEISNSIVFFENKYNGEYHHTLGMKKESDLTPLEKKDAGEWLYLLSCVHGGNG